MLMTMGAKAPKRIIFQVADVHKPLLSISKVADAGYECHLHGHGGYLLDVSMGEKVRIQKRGSLYPMRGWLKEAKAAGFGRPG